jgi:trigger factor
MNITKENIDALNAILKIEIRKPDYEEKVETVLKDYRKKANIKGFRPGMTPIGLVKKMYGKAVKADEINKLVSENLQKYITDEKLEVLGDPLQKIDEDEIFDFDNDENFSFTFELGLTPDFEVKLSKKNKLYFYEIIVDEKMKSGYADNYTRRFGDLHQAETIEGNDVIKCKIEAVDNAGNIIAEGPAAEETSLGVDLIKDDAIKQMFIGKSLNDVIDFNLKKAFPNETEIAGILTIKKEEVEKIGETFRFTVKEISRFKPAEVGKELFDKIYGEGVVATEEEFMKKLEEEIAFNLKRESEYKLSLDIKKMAIEKTPVDLPDDFLKRWLLRINEKATQEQIDAEFEHFKNDLKWQLIKNKVAKDNKIQITEEDIFEEAKKITRVQFNKYGLYHVTDEQIGEYAKETLKKEDDIKRIVDKILDEKVTETIKTLVKIDNKSVTAEEFDSFFK